MALINALRVLSALSWLAVLVIIAVMVMRAARQQKARGLATGLVVVIILAVALNVLSAGLVFIEPTERGVVITIASGGVRPVPLEPGLHWIIPYAESVKTYSISTETYTMSIAHSEGQMVGDDSVEARTSDGQVVKVDASVIFKIDPAHVIDKIHIEWRGEYVDLLVRPIARGVIRDAISQYGVEEVYSSQRDSLKVQMEAELTKTFQESGLVLVDFVLRNITFSDEYNASVEQKQIAEQQAQQAKFVVEQKRQEAEQARQAAEGLADSVVIKAQGDADALIIQAQAEAEARLIQAQAEAQALELLGQAIEGNPNVLTLEYIQKLAPNIQIMLLSAENPFLLPLPDFQSGGVTPTSP